MVDRKDMVDPILQLSGETWNVSKSTFKDAESLSTALRAIDLVEVRANNSTPIQSLTRALENDDKTYTINMIPTGTPIMMFGVGTFNNINYIWLLGSDEILTIKRDFIKHSKFILDELTKPYDMVLNYVHKNNTIAIRWLRWLGVKFLRELDINNEPFYEFIYV